MTRAEIQMLPRTELAKIVEAALAVVRKAEPPTRGNIDDGLIIPANVGYKLEMALVNAGVYNQVTDSGEDNSHD